MEYDDDHATCERTYATLRIYPGDNHPDVVTRTLHVEPSSTQIAHVPDAPSGARAARRPNAWLLSSNGRVTSRDCRRHIDWLIEQIAPHRDALRALVRDGARADVSSFWVSATGHGGPSLHPRQMAALSELELEIWFDIYEGGAQGSTT